MRTVLFLLSIFLFAAAVPVVAQQPGNVVEATSITNNDLGRTLIVDGAIRKVEVPDEDQRPFRLIFKEQPEVFEVIFWSDIAEELFQDRGLPPVGTKVRARGEVIDYRGRLQVKVQSDTQIWIEGYPNTGSPSKLLLPGGRLPQTADGKVTNPRALNRYFEISDFETLFRLQGNLVSVRGTVADFRASWSSGAPNIIYLREGDRQLEIVYWNRSNLPVENLTQPGTSVFATGESQLYNGRLQINVQDPVNNLSSQELPRERLAGNLIMNPNAPANEAAAVARQQAAPAPRVDWQRYSPLAAQQTLAADGEVLIYARSERVELCRLFERNYLLHPDAIQLLAPRTIYFLDVSDSSALQFARSLRIARVPTLVVLRNDSQNQYFTFQNDTQPQQVYQFMKGL